MIIHDNFHFHPPCSIGEEVHLKCMAPGSHVRKRYKDEKEKKKYLFSSPDPKGHVSYCHHLGHLGFSIGPKSNNTWLAACNDHS
jgi:hypothetical protein